VLPGAAADREHGGVRLLRNGRAALRGIVEIDERPCGRVDLLAVDGERRVPGHDRVDLLVPELRLGVVLDDLVTGVGGGVRVDPERGHAERLAHGLPDERAEDGDSFDLVEREPLHCDTSRSASRTIGSIASAPSTRSSRFSTPAQLRSAAASPPS